MQLQQRDLSGLAGTFLGDIDDDARQALFADAALIEVPRGRQVFADGGDEPRMAFLLEGNTRTYLPGPGGRQLTVRYARAGSVVATGTPGVAGNRTEIKIQAVTACALLDLNPTTVRGLMLTNPGVARAVAVELTRRLEDVHRHFAATVLGTIRERLAAHLLDTAETSTRGGLIAPVGQQALADALGSAREVVSRALTDMQRDGLVNVARGGIVLVEPSLLVAVAGRWWLPTRLSAIDLSLDPAATLDASPNPVLALDAGGDIVYASPSVAATFGWTPHELVGQNISLLLPPEIVEPFRAIVGTFMSQAKPGPIGLGSRFHGRRSDGSVFPAEITILPARGPSGRLVFAAVLDIGYRTALRTFLSERFATDRTPPTSAV